MKQPPPAPLPKRTCHPAGWPVFCGSVGLYLFAFYLADLVLLASSSGSWNNINFILRQAPGPLIHGIVPALGSLLCPFGLTFLFLPLVLDCRHRFLMAVAGPLLALTLIMIWSQIREPHTSQRRIERLSKTPLPQKHWNYLAYHPLGSTTFTRAMVGIREYCSFDLDPESLRQYIGTRQPSTDRQVRLQASPLRVGDLPAELGSDPLDPDAVFYELSAGADLIVHPGSARVLIVCFGYAH